MRHVQLDSPVSNNVQVGPNVLLEGELYRLEIDQSGVYKIDRNWFLEHLGEVPPLNTIHLFGIFGGVLDHDSSLEETERLRQLSLWINGNDDNSLDDGEEVWFYAENQDEKKFNQETGLWELTKNPFTESNSIILKISGQVNSKVLPIDQISPSFNPTSKYWYGTFYHEDRVNLLDDFISTQGSGQVWYGDELTNRKILDLSDQLSIPSRGLTESITHARVAGRSSVRESVTFSVGNEETIRQFSPVNVANIEALYARNIALSIQKNFVSNSETIKLTFERDDQEARAWLDYADIQGWTDIIYENSSFVFNNAGVLKDQVSDGIFISTQLEPVIWDITDKYSPTYLIASKNSDGISFNASQSEYSEYMIFDGEQTILPKFVEKISTVDLMELGNVDLVILSTSATFDAARRLQQHRESFNNLSCSIIDPQDIYNAYSGGKLDPTAIRNYFRDLYHTHPRFGFVLLLGDASFDYRYINEQYPADNIIPTFETFHSLDPLLAFPTDDYYALLDNGETGDLIGDLDIAIGRITVSTPAEADAVINKIISYDDEDDQINTWRTRTVFVADDEDNNLHINDADVIATELAKEQPLLNQRKIYFDAYRQESTPGGNRYPGATDDLNQVVNQGALVVNYLGHGGPNGWAQERVLKIDDINSWSNFERLPLIITATCSFTGFDDPSRKSAGEIALLRPNGGALSLFTTVRSVFASKNFQLTRSVFRNLFVRENGSYLPIGEIILRAKNDNPTDNTNARKFFLIGDPTIQLKIPELDITTDEINGIPLSDSSDAIPVSALDPVAITGSVRNSEGQVMNDFNGEVDIVVYDKPSQVRTFANDNRSFVKNFSSQQNIIFLGRVPVQNGQFSINFTIPLDIDYSIGNGKISYFARSELLGEAAGISEHLQIGGSSTNPQLDDTPPNVTIFLNNRRFVSGDEVPPSNKVIVDLSDDLGINFSNAAIGHEITGILDNDAKTTMILNDFVQTRADQTSGATIVFDITELTLGSHELTVRAFDVANNVGESTITFHVTDEIERVIKDITNAPNPFNHSTIFDIEHELIGDAVDVLVQVFNERSEVVDQFRRNEISRGGIISLRWEPAFLDQGLYFCRFTLRSSSTGETSDSYVKKVLILK